MDHSLQTETRPFPDEDPENHIFENDDVVASNGDSGDNGIDGDDRPREYQGERRASTKYMMIPLCLYFCALSSVEPTASVYLVGYNDPLGCNGSGGDYRGSIAATTSDIPCQSWSSQEPHSHDLAPQEYPQSDLEDNFCRNPDISDSPPCHSKASEQPEECNGFKSPWCYTTDPRIRTEVCAIDCELSRKKASGVGAKWDLELRFTVAVISFFVIAFLGCLSDYKGRKVVLIGMTAMTCVGKIIWTIFVYKKAPLSYLFIAQVVQGLSGDWPLMLILAFAYSADCSTVKDKQVNFGRIEAASYAGEIFGPWLGGALYRYWGDWTAWFVSSLLLFICTIYFIFIPESLLPSKRAQTLDRKHLNPVGVLSIMTARHHRVILMLVLVFGYGAKGSRFVLNFFAIGKFGWDSAQTGLFGSVQNAYKVLVVLYFVPYTRLCRPKWHAMFNIRSSLFGFATASILFFLTPFDWTFYLIAILNSLGSITVLCVRTISSNHVQPHRQAMGLSAIGIIEALINIFLTPTYEAIYYGTATTFPGCAFLVGAIVACIAAAISLCVKKQELYNPLSKLNLDEDNTSDGTRENSEDAGEIQLTATTTANGSQAMDVESTDESM